MKRFPLLLLAVLVLAACASFTERTQSLTLGMSTFQVKKALGSDYTVQASRYGADGRPIEIWDYKNPDTGEPLSLAFKNDKLVQWGSPEALRTMGELHGPDDGQPSNGQPSSAR